CSSAACRPSSPARAWTCSRPRLCRGCVPARRLRPLDEDGSLAALEMTRELDLLRVDQVGSLLRPEALKQVFERHGRGQATDEELREAEDASIRDVVRKEETHNLPVVTDGEYRRLNFQDSFANSVAGFAATANSVEHVEARNRGGQPMQRWETPKEVQGPAIVQRRPVMERLRL